MMLLKLHTSCNNQLTKLIHCQLQAQKFGLLSQELGTTYTNALK
jgi:hypothetical protein